MQKPKQPIPAYRKRIYWAIMLLPVVRMDRNKKEVVQVTEYQ
jgi:hypothetical protein